MTFDKTSLRKLAGGALALATAAAALPQTADASTYRHRVERHHAYRHYDSSCHDRRQRRGANGARLG